MTGPSTFTVVSAAGAAECVVKAVGDHGVHTPRGHGPQVRGCVDGPHVDGEAGGVRPGDADGHVSGYSVLQADDMDSAVALVRDHPFVTRGGSLQVTEAVSP